MGRIRLFLNVFDARIMDMPEQQSDKEQKKQSTEQDHADPKDRKKDRKIRCHATGLNPLYQPA